MSGAVPLTAAPQSAPAYAREAAAARSGVTVALMNGNVKDAVAQYGRLATATNSTDTDLLYQIAITALTAAVMGDDVSVRIDACRALLTNGPHQCKDDMRALAEMPDLPLVTRLAAAAVLGDSDPAYKSSFANLARVVDSNDQLAVLNTSRELPSSESLPILSEMLKSDDFGVQTQAISMLAENGDPRALGALRAFVESNPGYSTRPGVTVSLARLGDPEALQTVQNNLDSLDGGDLLIAGEALARSGDSRGLDALRRLVMDDNELIRLDAAAALVRYGDNTGETVLRDALSNENQWIRLRAMELIEQLPAANDRRVWELMADDDASVRFRAAAATLAACRRSAPKNRINPGPARPGPNQ